MGNVIHGSTRGIGSALSVSRAPIVRHQVTWSFNFDDVANRDYGLGVDDVAFDFRSKPG